MYELIRHFELASFRTSERGGAKTYHGSGGMAEQGRRVRDLLRPPRVALVRGAPGADVRFDGDPRPCVGGGQKRMARPGCKRQLEDGVNSLHKRIRHVGLAAAAKMEIRAFRSS